MAKRFLPLNTEICEINGQRFDAFWSARFHLFNSCRHRISLKMEQEIIISFLLFPVINGHFRQKIQQLIGKPTTAAPWQNSLLFQVGTSLPLNSMTFRFYTRHSSNTAIRSKYRNSVLIPLVTVKGLITSIRKKKLSSSMFQRSIFAILTQPFFHSQ